GEADEPLLGTVVEVALQAAALGVAGRNDPRARRPELAQLRPRLGTQALVVHRQPRRRPDLALQRATVECGRVVHDRSDRAPLTPDRGDGSPGAARGRGGGTAVAVDPGAAVGE